MVGARLLAVTQDVHRPLIPAQRGTKALMDALELQGVVRERASAPLPPRGRRDRLDVVDIEALTVTSSARPRWLMVVLVSESVLAVIAVAVLIAYLVIEGPTPG
jgi:hypothetical protein